MRAGRHDLVIATCRPRRRALPSVPLVTYEEDLPVVRRYWRTVFGEQLTLPNPYAVASAVAAGAGYSVQRAAPLPVREQPE